MPAWRISPKARHACLARITREPKPWTSKSFGEVEWLPEASIDPAIVELLPSGALEMTAKDLATIDRWFGARGKFPAVHIPTGERGFLSWTVSNASLMLPLVTRGYHVP